jgi:hypothetical protein
VVRENEVGLGTVLLIVLVLALIGVYPGWPYSNRWGYGPGVAIGALLVVLLILLATGWL